MLRIWLIGRNSSVLRTIAFNYFIKKGSYDI